MRRLTAAAVALLAFFAAACTEPSGAPPLLITGAGASFPYPLYSKWFADYHRLHADVQINYQSLGSGAGIRQLTNRTVLFGASDYPLTREQQTAAAGRIRYFPTVLGAVVPVYNVPGITSDLRFTGPLLAGIFLGHVTRWDDPWIRGLNPDASLPALDIAVVHRSDGSGSSYVLADFLAKTSPEWLERVGVGASVHWPVGVGVKGNDGVAGFVKQTPGALGYIEPIYATLGQLRTGAVQNASGRFISASTAAVTAAASQPMPADFRVSITNAPGADAYPIASFTWILLNDGASEIRRTRAMTEFLAWALTDGQRYAAPLGYAPLPQDVVDLEIRALSAMTTP